MGNTWARDWGSRGRGQGRWAAEWKWGLHGEAKPFWGNASSRESGPGCVERALLVLLLH